MTVDSNCMETLMTRHHNLLSDIPFRQVSRCVLFSQKDFWEQANMRPGMGLCAGLLQVWWSYVQNGQDGIAVLQHKPQEMTDAVYCAQLRSVYFRRAPIVGDRLSSAEAQLLILKYGHYAPLHVGSLVEKFGVRSLLELDLVLQLRVPIVARWEFSHSADSILQLVVPTEIPILYVVILRYWDSKRQSAERGHRIAFVCDLSGGVRFYDPRWGEVYCKRVDDFRLWFVEYWRTAEWDRILLRGSPPTPQIRVYEMAGTLSAECSEICAGIVAQASAKITP